MQKHQNKIVYSQKFKNNLIKSPIINNNDNSFREEYSLNKKKKNHTIFIGIINIQIIKTNNLIIIIILIILIKLIMIFIKKQNKKFIK